jgi:cytoskeletal protein RodZ
MLAKNESQMDRAIRLVVGLVLLAVGYQIGGWLQIVLWVLAIIALITAATGTCWLYKILNINTAKSENETAASAGSSVEPKEEPKIQPAVEPEEETEEITEEEAPEEAEEKIEEAEEEKTEEVAEEEKTEEAK